MLWILLGVERTLFTIGRGVVGNRVGSLLGGFEIGAATGVLVIGGLTGALVILNGASVGIPVGAHMPPLHAVTPTQQ